jgi:hypothetical protein
VKLDLQALTKNPKILGAAAVGVIGLGLVARKKAGGDVSAPAAAAPASTGYSAGGQVSGASGSYDSSASDIYGALSPQLSAIGSQLDKLNGGGAPPTPVPTLGAGFYREAGGTAIYKVSEAGERDKLTLAEWLDFRKKGANWTPITSTELNAQTKAIG